MAENLKDFLESTERIYAQALLEIAEASGQVALLAQEMRELGELVRQEPALRRLLAARVIPVRERARILERVFQGQLSETAYRFVQVVNRKNRLELLEKITRAFERLVEEKHGRLEVDAYVAQPLSNERAAAVAQQLGSALAREVVLHQHVDNQLIGGLKLRVGDRLIDGSVATQLKIIRQRLIEQGRQRAREQAQV